MSILETFHRPNGASALATPEDEDKHRDVRGLARMVQVSPAATLIDLTLRGVSPGTYRATIRASGDLSAGASSTGPVWSGTDMGGAALDEAGEPRGVLATFEVGTDGRAAVFLDKGLQVWEVIGRGMVVTRQEEKVCRVPCIPENFPVCDWDSR